MEQRSQQLGGLLSDLATKDDVRQVLEKVEWLVRAHTEFVQRLVVLEQRPRYEQPCETARKMMDVLISMQTAGCPRLQEHIKHTQDVVGDWRKGLVQLVAGLMLAILSGALGYIVSVNIHHPLKQTDYKHTEDWKGLP